MDLDHTHRKGVSPSRWQRIEAAFRHAAELDGAGYELLECWAKVGMGAVYRTEQQAGP